MSVVIFEDEHVAQLDPVALGKPAFAIHCGSLRLVDVAEQLKQPLFARVRPHLAKLVAADFPQCQLAVVDAPSPALWINARLVPSTRVIEQLRSLWQSGKPCVVPAGSAIAAAIVPAGTGLGQQPPQSPTADDIARLKLPVVPVELPLFEYPHDIIRHHLTTLAGNLEHRVASGQYAQVADGVFAAPGAKLGQFTVCDTSRGPIVLDEGAAIGPFCYLSGPVYVGRSARVLEHAALKDCVAIGHTAKVGGEVEASIIEPYTNKQHHGFMGHSYLGSWINLGAGTCNSDLKNTYGQVNMEYHGQKVATGMQFVGAIIGDYAKTAINTGVFTGKTIGACSMVYGFVTTNVPSFVNYARLFGQVTEAPVEVMIATQRRMFERRGVTQRPVDIQLLHDMYALTIHERQRSGEALSLEPLSL